MLADKFGATRPGLRLKLVAIVMLLAAPCWAMVFLTQNTWLMVSLFILPGALLGFYLGPTQAMLQSLVDRHIRASAAAILIFFINIVGLGLGPLLVGALSDALAVRFGSNSFRLALLIVPPLCVWGAYHYEMASRSVERGLGRIRNEIGDKQDQPGGALGGPEQTMAEIAKERTN
jgi:MFS family permease